MFAAVAKSSCGLNGKISSVKARPRIDFFMLLFRLLRNDVVSIDPSVKETFVISLNLFVIVYFREIINL